MLHTVLSRSENPPSNGYVCINSTIFFYFFFFGVGDFSTSRSHNISHGFPLLRFPNLFCFYVKVALISLNLKL